MGKESRILLVAKKDFMNTLVIRTSLKNSIVYPRQFFCLSLLIHIMDSIPSEESHDIELRDRVLRSWKSESITLINITVQS